jgi:hypothetical protein
MASWARVAGACAQATRGLLRQEAQLGRAAQQAGQQSRGFAAGKWWEAADTAEGAGGERGWLAAGCGRWRRQRQRRGAPLTPPAALLLPAAGGHGEHESVTHAGLSIHKAASWHVYTGQAFAGVMWCVAELRGGRRICCCCCCFWQPAPAYSKLDNEDTGLEQEEWHHSRA